MRTCTLVLLPLPLCSQLLLEDIFKDLLWYLLAREGVYAPGRPALLAHAMQKISYIVGLMAYG